jgi:plasmid stability protein
LKFDINDCIDCNEVRICEGGSPMANITIRDIPDSAKEALRVRAAKAGVSLEAYAREVLHAAARASSQSPTSDLLRLSREFFGKGKGVELELPARASTRQTVEFD